MTRKAKRGPKVSEVRRAVRTFDLLLDYVRNVLDGGRVTTRTTAIACHIESAKALLLAALTEKANRK